MAKSEMLHARIDAELKQNVENIFIQLGMTATDAIKLFYKQVELNGGLPFEVKVPKKEMTKAEALSKLLHELKLGEQSAESGLLTLDECWQKMGL